MNNCECFFHSGLREYQRTWDQLAKDHGKKYATVIHNGPRTPKWHKTIWGHRAIAMGCPMLSSEGLIVCTRCRNINLVGEQCECGQVEDSKVERFIEDRMLRRINVLEKTTAHSRV